MVIQNCVRVRSLGTIFKSTHRHDFVSFKTTEVIPSFGPSDKKEDHFIDGGNDYSRRSFSDHSDIEDLNLWPTSSIEEVVEKLVWGSRGITGKEPLTYTVISEMSPEYLSDLNGYLSKNSKFSLHAAVVGYWLIKANLPKDFPLRVDLFRIRELLDLELRKHLSNY